jgi:hypothetical protein
MRIIPAALAFAAIALPAQAQDSGWSYSLTTYLWATDTSVSAETPTGHTVEGELSFSDALKDLDFAFMGSFEARNGKWGLLTDAMYFKLSPGNETPGPLVDEVNMRTQMTVLSAYAAYRAYEDPTVAIDLAGGLRWAKLDTDVSLSGGPLDGQDFSSDDDWVEPVIGVRLNTRLSDRWSATLFADYGGFDGDSDTWQAAVSLGYELNDRWTLRGGYRYMEFNREIDGRDISLDQSGLLLGATYRF